MLRIAGNLIEIDHCIEMAGSSVPCKAAHLLMQQGQFEIALAELGRAILGNPADSVSWACLEKLYQRMGMVSAATVASNVGAIAARLEQTAPR